MRALFKTEDWWAIWVGLSIFLLSLAPSVGADLLGWAVSTREWVDVTKAIAPASKAYGDLPAIASLALTYLFLTLLLGIGAAAMGFKTRQFLLGFMVIFGLSYLCWLAGNYAHIAATPNKRAAMGLSWSLGLTGEAGYLIALAAGLAIGNLAPRFAGWLKEATRPEWFIKSAIVLLGGWFALKAVDTPAGIDLYKKVMLRGFAAIIEAYLIYWALVYFIARKYFGFSREWAAPLASGISICGVSAAIATGGAIRARPIVPIMVSSLVVLFSVVELVLLPFLAQTFLANEPMVAAAWMGLAVKTDGAAVASGAITESLIYAKAETAGIVYEPSAMLFATTTVKVFIDIFIGVWAFILALVWAYGIRKETEPKVSAIEIWQRFPRFVLGYFLTFGVILVLGLSGSSSLIASLKIGTEETDAFRRLFFVMTFFTIGLVSDFKKLWAEGIGKLALVYIVSLFGFIIWIGLAISWIFFHGVVPPLKGSS